MQDKEQTRKEHRLRLVGQRSLRLILKHGPMTENMLGNRLQEPEYSSKAFEDLLAKGMLSSELTSRGTRRFFLTEIGVKEARSLYEQKHREILAIMQTAAVE